MSLEIVILSQSFSSGTWSPAVGWSIISTISLGINITLHELCAAFQVSIFLLFIFPYFVFHFRGESFLSFLTLVPVFTLLRQFWYIALIFHFNLWKSAFVPICSLLMGSCSSLTVPLPVWSSWGYQNMPAEMFSCLEKFTFKDIILLSPLMERHPSPYLAIFFFQVFFGRFLIYSY